MRDVPGRVRRSLFRAGDLRGIRYRLCLPRAHHDVEWDLWTVPRGWFARQCRCRVLFRFHLRRCVWAALSCSFSAPGGCRVYASRRILPTGQRVLRQELLRPREVWQEEGPLPQ
jgi:hypothetical protein